MNNKKHTIEILYLEENKLRIEMMYLRLQVYQVTHLLRVHLLLVLIHLVL